MLLFELGSHVLCQQKVEIKTSEVRNRDMRKNSHTFYIFLSDRVNSTEKLHNRDLKIMTSHIEKANIDRIRIIPRDGKVNSCCWILVDKSQNRKLSQWGSIDEGIFSLETPMRRNSQNWILDIWISLLRTVFFNVLEYHSYKLLKGQRILPFFEPIGPVLEVITFQRFFKVKWFYQFVKIEVAQFRFLLPLGKSIVLEVSNSLKEGNLSRVIDTPLLLFLPEREF